MIYGINFMFIIACLLMAIVAVFVCLVALVVATKIFVIIMHFLLPN